MPFTGSHPAAVLPLLRTRLVTSALVIGSMTPDAPLFGLSPVPYATTHSPEGIVTADLCLGLAFYIVWHVLLVPPAVALAPPALRARLPRPARRFAGFSASSTGWLVLLAISVVIGAATHVAWDEFTHAGRWGARHIGVLSESFHGLAGYQWAQYLSGLLGALLILLHLVRWWRRSKPRVVAPEASAFASAACAFVVLAAAGGAAVAAALSHLSTWGGAELQAGVYAATVRGIRAGAVAGVVVAAAWHIARAARASTSRHR